MKGERNILLVINPAAGRASYEKRLTYLEKKLRDSHLTCTNFFTRRGGEGELASFMRENPEIDEVIILGGDGTLNYVVNELLEKPVLLSIVSNGTGNDSVKSLHGEMRFQKQVEIALHGKIKRFDLGICNGRAFVNGVGIGFDGQVVQRMAARKKKRGSHLDYLFTVIRTLAKFKEKSLRFSLDGKTFERKVLLMTVSNGTTFGGGFKINPLACSDDGFLDVCLLNEISPFLRFWHLPRLRTGSHQYLRQVELFKAKRVLMQASDELVAHLDGEYAGHPPFELSILPQALELRVPL